MLPFAGFDIVINEPLSSDGSLILVGLWLWVYLKEIWSDTGKSRFDRFHARRAPSEPGCEVWVRGACGRVGAVVTEENKIKNTNVYLWLLIICYRDTGCFYLGFADWADSSK